MQGRLKVRLFDHVKGPVMMASLEDKQVHTERISGIQPIVESVSGFSTSRLLRDSLMLNASPNLKLYRLQ